MYRHALDAMMGCDHIDSVVIATDDEDIAKYANDMGLIVVHRTINATTPDEPIFDVIKFAYKSLDRPYDIIVNIMANSIGHKSSDIDKGLELIVRSEAGEIRSYGEDGIENGILILDSLQLPKHELSTYVGMIQTEASEIHYKWELNDTQKQ